MMFNATTNTLALKHLFEDEKLSLVDAWLDGSTIQRRLTTGTSDKDEDNWVDDTTPTWNPEKTYRVKPAPTKVELLEARLAELGH